MVPIVGKRIRRRCPPREVVATWWEYAYVARMRTSLAVCVMSALLAGCGDSGSSGGAGGATGVGPGAGTPTITTLAGVWTADETRATGLPAVTVELGGGLFSLRIGEITLRASANGPSFDGVVLVDRGAGLQRALGATITRKSAESGTLGAIPLPLTGGLRIDSGDPTAFCQSVFVDGSITANCADSADLGYLLPGSAARGSANGVRLSKAASAFGDFGGTWSVQLSGGGSCTASFVGNTVSASCLRADTHTGSFTITFDGDSASGSTSEGIEFVATRQ
jgi:hypothetical protein